MPHPHAEILRRITEEAERGGMYWTKFEYDFHDGAHTPISAFALFDAVSADLAVRRKPRTVTITGPGGTFSYSEPMREAPPTKTYYMPDPAAPKALIYECMWDGGETDQIRLATKMCHTTYGAAKQHARALILASGGSLDNE